MIALSDAETRTILDEHKFFSRAAIPGETYAHVDPISTIAVGALWLTSSDVPDDLVHAICTALWSEKARAALDEGHPQGKHIKLESALDGIAIPLHPGAEQCYRELDVLE